MVDFDGDVPVKDSEGLTPLMYAAKKDHTVAIGYLTKHKINDLNEEDINGLTILMYTMFAKNNAQGRKLIKQGANLNYVNSNGNTCLMYCV